MTERVTPAQEAITASMLATLVTCAAASYSIIEYLSITDPSAYAVLALISFVIGGYLVPNLTALWLGRPLNKIMQ